MRIPWAKIIAFPVMATCLTFSVWVAQRGTPPPDHPYEAPASYLKKEADREAARAALRAERPVMAFLGDSYTGGSLMGGGGKHNYTDKLTQDLGYDRLRFAVGGTGFVQGRPAKDFANRVPDIIEAQPAIVLIEGGHNDVGKFTNGRIEKAARKVVRDLKDGIPGVHIVISGVLWPGEPAPQVRQLDAALREIARDEHADFIDTNGEKWFVGKNLAYIGEDGTHPTNEGHAHMARLYERDLRKLDLPAGVPWPDENGRLT